MFWILFILLLLIFVIWMCNPTKNQYGTFGDDNYNYEQEAKDRGWIE